MQLDYVVSGRAEFRSVIDGIAAMADGLISVLRAHRGSTVDLEAGTAPRGRGRAATDRKPRSRQRSVEAPTVKRAPGRRRTSRSKPAEPVETTPAVSSGGPSSREPTNGGAMPSAKMVAYARNLASSKSVPLPPGFDTDFGTCRRFLDQHAR